MKKPAPCGKNVLRSTRSRGGWEAECEPLSGRRAPPGAVGMYTEPPTLRVRPPSRRARRRPPAKAEPGQRLEAHRPAKRKSSSKVADARGGWAAARGGGVAGRAVAGWGWGIPSYYTPRFRGGGVFGESGTVSDCPTDILTSFDHHALRFEAPRLLRAVLLLRRRRALPRPTGKARASPASSPTGAAPSDARPLAAPVRHALRRTHFAPPGHPSTT